MGQSNLRIKLPNLGAIAVFLQIFASATGFAAEAQRSTSPLNRLDSARIPAAERLSQVPELVAVLRGKSSASVVAFALSKNGRLVASHGDGTIEAWDLSGVEPAERGQLKLPGRGWAASVDLSPNEGRLYCASDGAVRLIDLTTIEPKQMMAIKAHPFSIPNVVVEIVTRLTKDGNRLASKGAQGPVRLWDVSSPKPREVGALPVSLAGGNFIALAFSPDGKLLAGASTTKVLWLWDLTEAKPRELPSLGHPSMVSAVDFTSDSQWLATGCGDRIVSGRIPKPNGEVRLWEAAAPLLTRPAELARHASFVTAVSLRPDGRVIASADFDGRLVLWDLATGKVIREWKVLGPINCAAFAPDGHHLVAGTENGTIYVLRLDLRLAQPLARTLLFHWDRLAAVDAVQAYSTILAMANDTAADRFLQERLPSVPRPDPKRVAALIAGLSADQFSVRESASNELKEIGRPVERALREALKATASPAVRRRLSDVIESVHFVSSVETLRRLRAIQVLERMASVKARQTLETLAQGATGAHETSAARAALDRLSGY
jgi:WD40 repeat protein